VLARLPAENPNPVLRIALDGTLLYTNMAGTSQLAEWNLKRGPENPVIPAGSRHRSYNQGLTQVLDLEHSKHVYSFFIAPVGACGYANLYGRDITERNRAEEKIKSQLDELQRWHDALNGREGRVLEVKKEVNELLARLGEPLRYSSVAEESGK